MAIENKEEQTAIREQKLMDDCRALIAKGDKGRAAAVSMYRLAMQCNRQAAMKALGLL